MPLLFADRTAPGISRQPDGDGFIYISARGRPIRDERALERIAAIVIPPAWTNVWIAPHAGWHIQATGLDAKGRLQYRYHAEFRQSQEAQKFSRLIKFAECLPKLREAVERHMAGRGLTRERALATLVYLLETTLIRIGNPEYARANASFGLSTLTPDHVEVQGAKLIFEFTGKSGMTWNVTVRDRRAAAVMRACQELPGQKLFQYLDEEGRRRAVTSADVNAYLREASGRRISAKDFRTWSGTMICAVALAKAAPEASQRGLKRQIAEAMREAARALGNTPAVCRSSYVHPAILDAHGSGELFKRLASVAAREAAPGKLKPHELEVVRLLRRLERAKAALARKAPALAVSAASAMAATL